MSKRITSLVSKSPSRVTAFWRGEDGSFIALSLILFLAIILVGGIGVDILRQDYNRVRQQNTSDAASLAATDLDQKLDPETVVNSYFDAAGLGDTVKTVKVSPPSPNRRQVSISAESGIDTWFMRAVGINSLASRTVGTAIEEIQEVEISLVLDVSGSMEGTRLRQLKTAAKKFVRTMLIDRTGQAILGKVSINIVPYSAQVVLDDHLMKELPLEQAHGYSNCLEFRGDQFKTTSLTDIGPIRQHAHVDRFSYANDKYDQGISDAHLDCSTRSDRRVTLMEDSIPALEQRIDSLTAQGNTSTEFGLKVGAALLDPGSRDLLSTHPDVPQVFDDRPYDYGRNNTLKVVVVMSDGQNTEHVTFSDDFPGDEISDTWAVRSNGMHYFTVADRERGYVDGDSYPNEPGYYPFDDSWGNYVLGGNNASRLTWQDVYGRVSLDWHAWFARAEQAGSGDDRRSKQSIFNYWRYNTIRVVGEAQKDADTTAICNALKSKDVLVFSIAFETPPSQAELLKSCATNENLHYNVSGEELNYAFSAIATSLNSLQLVQ